MNRNFGKNLRTPAYAAVTAALLAASAWIVIPAAVPFTLQTFVLYVCAGLLPSGVCLRAAAVYILLGCIGLPVFSGMQGGAGILLGATGGYIVGFLPLVLIEGALRKKATFAGMLLGTAALYAFGTAWYMLVYASGSDVSLSGVLALAVFPFILPDLCKMLLALTVIKRLKGTIR